MTVRQIIKKLKDAGWTFRDGSGHTVAYGPDGNKQTVIQRHKGDVPIGTLMAIQRQTGISMK